MSQAQCDDITVDFRRPERPEDKITINGMIGISDEAEVDIRCECTGPRGVSADWTQDGELVSKEYEDLQTPYNDVDGPRASLKIDSFEEDATGEYSCISQATTETFNLVWFDPG